MLKYYYKYSIVLFHKINILLKFNYIIYCKDLLNQILTYFLINYNLITYFFNKYFKDSIKLFFKIVKIYKYYTKVFTIIF